MMLYRIIFLVPILALLLGGCVNKSSDSSDTDSIGTTPIISGDETLTDPIGTTLIISGDETLITGSVGDGPVVGARVACFDAHGKMSCNATSDNNARYSITLSAETAFPVTIEVTGGIDLVTGREPDFILRSVVLSPDATIININPYTTLILRAAKLFPGGITRRNVQLARDSVLDQLHFGITGDYFSDPITSHVDENNVASVIKATEVLGELLRRTEQELQLSGNTINIEGVIDAIAADLVDGIIDGRGKIGVSKRVSVTAAIVGAQLAFESLSNSIHVDGKNAMDALEMAVHTTAPETVGSSMIRGVPVPATTLRHAVALIRGAADFSSSETLNGIGTIIENLSSNISASETENALLGSDGSDFYNTVVLLRTASQKQISAAAIRLRTQRLINPDRGVFALVVDPQKFEDRPLFSGGIVRLQWEDIEPADGVFDFTLLDQKLSKAASADVAVTVQINGNRHPDYLFEKVPYSPVAIHKQVLDNQGTLMYWHPQYIQAHRRMLNRFANHIRTSPYRKYVLGVRQNFNAIGTEMYIVSSAYINLSQWIVPPGVIPEEAWTKRIGQIYRQKVLSWYEQFFDPDIHVFARSPLLSQWAIFSGDRSASYYSTDQQLAASYQNKINTGLWSLVRTSSEMEPRSIWGELEDSWFIEYCRSGKTTCFTEPWRSSQSPDIESQQNPLPASASQWNYWRILHDLHVGSTYLGMNVDDWNLYDDTEYGEAFEFGARYAGYQSEPEMADGAWVAFRDGHYSRGDYNFLMRRLEIDTSVGIENVGPDGQRFGYWARSFSAGDAAHIEVNDRFATAVETSDVIIEVTYFDENGSSFTINSGGLEKTIHGIGTNSWKRASLLISGNNLNTDINGAQIRISTDAGVILHMVEIRRNGA